MAKKFETTTNPAVQKSSRRFPLDFYKLLDYLKHKYPKLKDVQYYEGIAKNDQQKLSEFKKSEKSGYTIKSLSRKSYINKAVIQKAYPHHSFFL